MLNPHPAHHGFTLIELIIGMTIIGILLASAAPSFRGWIQNSQIRTAAEAIQNGLQLARVEAVRRNALICFELPNATRSDWNIRAGSCTSADIIQTRSSTEGSPNATMAADQTTIVFNGLGRVTPVPAGNINIDITNSTGGSCASLGGPMRCLRVVTSIGGQVRMCDPALTLSSTYPQGC